YHPTVFAPAVGTPAIAIAPSYYSSVRMRGALGNVGLSAFVLPTTSLHLMRDAVASAINPDQQLQKFLASAQQAAVAFQSRWWDAMVQSITTDSPMVFDGAPTPEQFVPAGQWSRDN